MLGTHKVQNCTHELNFHEICTTFIIVCIQSLQQFLYQLKQLSKRCKYFIYFVKFWKNVFYFSICVLYLTISVRYGHYQCYPLLLKQIHQITKLLINHQISQYSSCNILFFSLVCSGLVAILLLNKSKRNSFIKVGLYNQELTRISISVNKVNM